MWEKAVAERLQNTSQLARNPALRMKQKNLTSKINAKNAPTPSSSKVLREKEAHMPPPCRHPAGSDEYHAYWERHFVREGKRLGARSRVFRLAASSSMNADKKKMSEKELRMSMARQSGNAALRTASKMLRDDHELVHASVRQCGNALCFASQGLRRNRSIVASAVDQCGTALAFAAPELQNDRRIVRQAVYENGWARRDAARARRRDRDMCLEAVRSRGLALQFVDCELLRDERECVLAAVMSDGRALQYASERLRGNWEVVMAACSDSYSALRHASSQLKEDPEIILAAMVAAETEAARYATVTT